MKRLINYIRSFFCKHEWELIDEVYVHDTMDFWGRTVDPYIIGKRWTYRCKKCGDVKICKNY